MHARTHAPAHAARAQGNTVLHFLENNYYRSAQVYDLLHRLVPDAMADCEKVRNVHGEAPHDVRIEKVDELDKHH
jgi:hypothetical protein